MCFLFDYLLIKVVLITSHHSKPLYATLLVKSSVCLLFYMILRKVNLLLMVIQIITLQHKSNDDIRHPTVSHMAVIAQYEHLKNPKRLTNSYQDGHIALQARALYRH